MIFDDSHVIKEPIMCLTEVQLVEMTDFYERKFVYMYIYREHKLLNAITYIHNTCIYVTAFKSLCSPSEIKETEQQREDKQVMTKG